MAATPSFAATPKVGAGLLTTADTSLTAPSTVTTILTGGSSGSKVDEIIIQGVATTVASVVNLFIHDGTTHHLFDQVLISAVTSSTTAIAYRARRQYQNLLLPTTSYTLRAAVTVTSSGIKVSAYGADF